VEKEKEKGISSLLGWGEGFWPARARARAWARARARLWPSCGPRARETARVRGDDGIAVGPLVSESRGGKRRYGLTAWANRPSGGERPVAGGLDSGLPPVARFLVLGEVA
jgi:hypothetical protein